MSSNTIAHFRNGVGNFIVLTPALQALAKMDASGKIDICTDEEWMDSRKRPLFEICERLPFINRVYGFREIKDKKYKTWFWTQWNSCGASLEYFKTKKYYEEPWNMLHTHESDYYFDIVKKHYGFTGNKPPQMIVPAEQPLLDMTKKNIVLVDGGFGEMTVMKKWGKFGQLAEQVKNYYGDEVCIIKIGYRDELSDVKIFDRDYVNQLSMTESAKVISQASVVIADDTGNMHCADALGIPLIVLWGGSILAKNRPINSKSKIIHAGLECQPCQPDAGYNRCEKIQCLDYITVGEVMYHLRQFLSKGEFT